MAGNPSCMRARRLREGNLSDLRRAVREKLRSGVFRLCRERRGSRRSAVWEHFRIVEDECGGSVGYAGCLHCLDVLRHDPHVSGTSSLFSHLRSCPVHVAREIHLPEATEMSEVIVKEELIEDDQQQDQQQESPLLDACVDFLALDLIPSQVLHGVGFVRLAQLLVDCGARQGSMDALTLLPTQRQVEARVAVRATEERQQLRSELVDGEKRGMSLVLCASPRQQESCILFLRTLHDWRFNTRFLGLCSPPALEVEHDESWTGIAAILKKFEMLEAWEKKLPLVWGGVMRGWDAAVPCASHMLCKAVSHLLQTQQPPLQQVREYLHKFRSLVRWALTTQDKELTDQLITDGGNHRAWQQTLAMVKGVCRMHAELKQAGPRQDLRLALGHVALALMEEFTAVLEPVRAASAELEASDTATLHKVVPWLLHLRNSCAANTEDNKEKAAMKAALLMGLDAHANPGSLHRIAMFFNPRMNSLKVLCVEEQQEVRKTVLRMTAGMVPPPLKGITTTKAEGPLAYLEDVWQDALTAEKEMEVYAIMRDHADPNDLLAWWCRNAPLLPLLAATAARILVIPASAATFTLDTISDKLLHPSPPEPYAADDFVFLHSRVSLN